MAIEEKEKKTVRTSAVERQTKGVPHDHQSVKDTPHRTVGRAMGAHVLIAIYIAFDDS